MDNDGNTFDLADDFQGNLRKLLAERLLATSRSGGGKSWLLRKILEETHGKVQQIVIDPDGEFASLRAQFDYLVCKPEGGDLALTPAMARILARKLMETGASAILDIYDMEPDDRQEFVALFLHELMNLPRELWHNLLVVMDEAHLFAPEGQKTDAGRAVIDLATRGRKRGFGLVLATQRLASLNKNVAAQMINKAIGGTGLDLDLTRSMGEIGSKSKEREKEIKGLKTGEFLFYGPAFGLQEPRKVKVGMVKTSHPEAGAGLMQATPAPSAQIKSIIAMSLADLPKQAEKVAETEAELRQELRAIKGAGMISQEEHLRILNHEIGIAMSKGYAEAELEAYQVADKLRQLLGDGLALLPRPGRKIEDVQAFQQRALANIRVGVNTLLEDDTLPDTQAVPAAALRDNTPGKAIQRDHVKKPKASLPVNPRPEGQEVFKKGARDILAQLAAAYPRGWSRTQVAVLVGMSPTSGTFTTYLSNLKKAEVMVDQEGILFATPKGKQWIGAGMPKASRTPEEMLELWLPKLKLGARRMLQALLQYPKSGTSRSALATLVEMQVTSGTFTTYLSNLKKAGLITVQDGVFRPSSMLTGK